MASSLKPPIPTSTASSGYIGGGLARTITSNDLQPAESIVARRRGELTLRDRDTIDRIPSRRSEETGDVRAEPGEADGDDEEEGKGEKPRLEGEVDEVDPAGMPEEWTFPDGGAKAWSVILVRSDRFRLDRRARAEGTSKLTSGSVATVRHARFSALQGCFLMSVNVQGYGMAWGALVGDLQKNHHPDTSLSILNLIVGLFNFVRARFIARTPVREPILS